MESQQHIEDGRTAGVPTPQQADENHVRLQGDEGVIPSGMYCYAPDRGRAVEDGTYPVTLCPYWGLDASRPEQENGYCAHLKGGDWDSEGWTLLWDQVKECRLRDDIPEVD